MVMLLAMFQKFKLIRQINEKQMQLVRLTNKQERGAKKIERVNEKYTSLFANLDSQEKLMKSNADLIFQRDSGLGVGSVNPYDHYGNNQYIYLKAQAILKDGYTYQTGHTNDDGSYETAKYKYNTALFNKMWQDYHKNGNSFKPATEDGTTEPKTTTRGEIIVSGLSDDIAIQEVYEYNGYNAYDVEAFNYAIQAASMQQQQTQEMVRMASSRYADNLSIFFNAERDKLENAQNQELEPLNFDDLMLQTKIASLQEAIKRLQAYEEKNDKLLESRTSKCAPDLGK